MTLLIAHQGRMGPDGVYRDPVAVAPKFSFMLAEPGVRAFQMLLVSSCLLCSLYLYSSAVFEFVLTLTSLLPSGLVQETKSFSLGWGASQQPTLTSTQLGLAVVGGTLLLYVWYRAVRRVALGYDLPDKLKDSSSPPPSMKGKIAVVTGGNCGIGLATTKQLARWGTHVLIGCRRVQEASVFAQQFQGLGANHTSQNDGVSVEGKRRNSRALHTSPSKEPPSGLGTIRVHYLDLSDLNSVQEFAQWVLAETGGKVDFLVNNAGMVSTARMTVDPNTGFEKHFVTNHLGPFLLTQLLLPALKQARGRIINVSSIAHVTHGPKLRALDYAVSPETAAAVAAKLRCPLSTLQGEPVSAKNYRSRRVYADTKMFNLWFTKALQRRLAAETETTATAYAAHPGMVNTDLMLHYSQGTANWLGHVISVAHRLIAPLVLKTPERGAATQLMLCVTDRQQLKPAAFYKDGVNTWVAPMALDEERQEELWAISTLLCQPYLTAKMAGATSPEGQKVRGRGRAA